jgi:hypothetical protein
VSHVALVAPDGESDAAAPLRRGGRSGTAGKPR